MDPQGMGNINGPQGPVRGKAPGTAAPSAAHGKAREHQALVRAARQFEAVFLNQLMQAMRKTVPDNELFNSKGPMKLYRQMQDAETAKALAAGDGGMGIADLIVQQLSTREDEPAGEPAAGSGMLPLDTSSPARQVEQYRRLSLLNDGTGQATRLRSLAARQGRAVADTLQRFEPQLRSAAEDAGLPPELLLAVVMEESGGDPGATSPKGARGLMQLMPATAAELGVRDPVHPGQNLLGGARYLARLLRKYDGDLDLSLAAYNAGPGTVDRAGRQVPPFRETRRYVDRVRNRFHELGGTDLALPGGDGPSQSLKPE